MQTAFALFRDLRRQSQTFWKSSVPNDEMLHPKNRIRWQWLVGLYSHFTLLELK